MVARLGSTRLSPLSSTCNWARTYGVAATSTAVQNLVYARVLTDNIDRMANFYREVLQLEPRSRDACREFQPTPGMLSPWSRAEFSRIVGDRAAEKVGPGSVMLEFQVDAADAEHVRLHNLQSAATDFVLRLTTLAWGNRSTYFRDHDGNLINFFTPSRPSGLHTT
jgi:catechol 2,3-dioxygenase-like lactoylglutathione lyase family enzyme